MNWSGDYICKHGERNCHYSYSSQQTCSAFAIEVSAEYWIDSVHKFIFKTLTNNKTVQPQANRHEGLQAASGNTSHKSDEKPL